MNSDSLCVLGCRIHTLERWNVALHQSSTFHLPHPRCRSNLCQHSFDVAVAWHAPQVVIPTFSRENRQSWPAQTLTTFYFAKHEHSETLNLRYIMQTAPVGIHLMESATPPFSLKSLPHIHGVWLSHPLLASIILSGAIPSPTTTLYVIKPIYSEEHCDQVSTPCPHRGSIP